MLFVLAFPVWTYLGLDRIIGMGLTKFSWQSTLLFLGMAAVGCAVAWLMVRPI